MNLLTLIAGKDCGNVHMAQRIYTASDQLLVSHLYILLERAGISALIQKSAVDVPLEESGPLVWYFELWIMRNRQSAHARRLLDQVLAGEVPGEVSAVFPGELPGALIKEFPELGRKISRFPPPSSPPAEIA